MDKIKNRLNETIKEADFKELSKFLNIDISIIYTWQRGEYLPSTTNYIYLSKFFNFSVDYLLARTDDCGCYAISNFNNFYNNLNKIIKFRKTSYKQMKQDGIVSANNIFKWKRGSIPTIETLIKLADYFSVSVDELLSI